MWNLMSRSTVRPTRAARSGVVPFWGTWRRRVTLTAVSREATEVVSIVAPARSIAPRISSTMPGRSAAMAVRMTRAALVLSSVGDMGVGYDTAMTGWGGK